MPCHRSLVLTLLGAVPAHLAGQAIPFSQHGEVSQRIGLTDVSLSYNRPVARGRVLFGPDGLVKWDRIWHPGADSATRLTVSRPVRLGGNPLPAGEYSLWLIPHADGPWTVIVSRAARVFHTPYPGEPEDLFRFEARPEPGSHMETLAWYFPVVARESAVLRLHWGTMVLPLTIDAPLAP
ncbi:MAG: DUF2911 domain-containing protein [Gemmatimonadales bacterium]